MGVKLQKNIDKQCFGVISRNILQSSLTISTKVVYSLLCSYAGKSGKCWPSWKSLQDDLKLSRATIARAISALKKAGIIKVKKSQYKCFYEILNISDTQPDALLKTSEVSIVTPLNTSEVSNPSNPTTIYMKNNNNTDEVKKSLHVQLKEIFLENHKIKTGNEFYWSGKDGNNLKLLIKKLKFTIESKKSDTTDENIIQLFRTLLVCPDKWIQEHWITIPSINSHYDEILIRSQGHGKKYSGARISTEAKHQSDKL